MGCKYRQLPTQRALLIGRKPGVTGGLGVRCFFFFFFFKKKEKDWEGGRGFFLEKKKKTGRAGGGFFFSKKKF